MKKILLLTAMLGVITSSYSREVININNGWRFSFGFNTTRVSPNSMVDVPHSWNFDATAVYRNANRGAANYMKDISVPAAWRNKKVYLRFYGVNSEADIFVNGLFVGEHKGGYTAFTLDITHVLKYGALNDIWVRANNSPQFDYIPVNGNFNQYGGIHRDVEIIVTDPVHISLSDNGSDGIYLKQSKITDQRATVEAAVKLKSDASANYMVSVTVTDPVKDSIVARKESRIKIDKDASANIAVDINNPRLWSGIEDPFLYNFTVKVADDKKIYDSVVIPMGLRYFEVDPGKGFSLNGKPYPIRGVTYYGDRAGRGIAMNRLDYEEDMDMIREMGATAVRTTNYPQDPYFYSLCDRYGIIVWSEIPLVGPEMSIDKGYFDKQSLKDSGKRILLEMISQYYNNTSVLFWGLFSNVSTTGDNPVPYIEELHSLATRTDPTRLTVATSNQDGEINYVTHLIGWSQYFGWKDGQVRDLNLWLGQLTRNWSKLRSAIGEYGAGGSITHQDQILRKPNLAENNHSERWQTNLHEEYYSIIEKYPAIWGSFAHSMFDFGSSVYTGGDTPGICDMGLVTYDRRYRKDAFYYYKARWNDKQPFVYIAERRWQERTSHTQTIKVFSNQESVELFVNDVSQGIAVSDNGIFKWNVTLREGNNEIDAFARNISDGVTVSINSRKTIW